MAPPHRALVPLLLGIALAPAGCVPYLGLPLPDTPEAHRCADDCSGDHAACLSPPSRPELPQPHALTKQNRPLLTRDDEQQRSERCDASYRTCLQACIDAAAPPAKD